MKALLLLVFLALLGFSNAPTAWGTVVTFDDLNDPTGFGANIPNGYQGFIWNVGGNFNFLNAVLLTNSYAHNGFFNGMVTISNVAYNAFGSPAEIDSTGTSFTFISAYMSGAWFNNLSVEVQGFNGTNLVYDQTNVVQATAPTFVYYNFQNINRLNFNSFGGQDAGFGIPNPAKSFVMDNFGFVFGAGGPGVAPFEVTAVKIQSTNVLLTWTAPQGTTNIVQATGGGAGGSYSTNFFDISPMIIIPGTNTTVGVTTNYMDVAGVTNKPARYYRVRYGP